MSDRSGVMNTIDAFERDIGLQQDYIRKLRLGKPIPKGEWEKVLLCGSGDSLAAAMLAASFSNYSMTAVDPLELAQNKEIARGKRVYFVSVSGNTKANILAAKSVRDSVAVTHNPGSRLAGACKDVVFLGYSDSGVVTSGSIGFAASALWCMSCVTSLRMGRIGAIFERAKKEAQKITLSGKVFFLGNQHTYPVAMYGAAKIYEVSGHDAHYEKTEQFFHMGLFCAKKGDTVILYEGGRRAKDLARTLRKLGLAVHCPESGAGNLVEKVIFYTFVSQFVALNLARSNRQTDCYFVSHAKLRDASSQTIY